MSEDPFSKWLKIPPGPRPPAAHVLLGLAEGTADGALIDAAAEKRLDLLDKYALSGDRATRAQVQMLMNEIARARTELIAKVPKAKPIAKPVSTPKRKRPATRPRRAALPPVALTPPVAVDPSPKPARRPPAQGGVRLPRSFWIIVGSGWALSILCATTVAYIVASASRAQPHPANPISMTAQLINEQDADPTAQASSRQPEPEQKIEPKPEPGPVTQIEPTVPQPKSEPQSEPKLQPEPAVQPQPEPQPEPQTQPTPQIAKPPLSEPDGDTEDFDAYLKQRDSLAKDPQAQIALIRDKLSELNGGIEVALESRIRDGKIDFLYIPAGKSSRINPAENHKIKDLSALTGLRVKILGVGELPEVESFEFLKTVHVGALRIHGNGILDLETVAQVKGLWDMILYGVRGTDFTAFRGKQPTHITLHDMGELESLEGMQGLRNLSSLQVHNCPRLTDISALSEARMTFGVGFFNTGITNLDAFKGQSRLQSAAFSDNSKLKSVEGLESCKSLRIIQLVNNPISDDDIAKLKSIYPNANWMLGSR